MAMAVVRVLLKLTEPTDTNGISAEFPSLNKNPSPYPIHQSNGASDQDLNSSYSHVNGSDFSMQSVSSLCLILHSQTGTFSQDIEAQ